MFFFGWLHLVILVWAIILHELGEGRRYMKYCENRSRKAQGGQTRRSYAASISCSSLPCDSLPCDESNFQRILRHASRARLISCTDAVSGLTFSQHHTMPVSANSVYHRLSANTSYALRNAGIMHRDHAWCAPICMTGCMTGYTP